MTPLKHLLWLEQIASDMDKNEYVKTDYSKGPWWRKAYDETAKKLSDEEITEYNRLVDLKKT